jgi:hypothetical protein
MNLQCGTAIVEECKFALDWTDENSFKYLTNEIVDVGTFGIKLAFGFVAS